MSRAAVSHIDPHPALAKLANNAIAVRKERSLTPRHRHRVVYCIRGHLRLSVLPMATELPTQPHVGTQRLRQGNVVSISTPTSSLKVSFESLFNVGADVILTLTRMPGFNDQPTRENSPSSSLYSLPLNNIL